MRKVANGLQTSGRRSRSCTPVPAPTPTTRDILAQSRHEQKASIAELPPLDADRPCVIAELRRRADIVTVSAFPPSPSPAPMPTSSGLSIGSTGPTSPLWRNAPSTPTRTSGRRTSPGTMVTRYGCPFPPRSQFEAEFANS